MPHEKWCFVYIQYLKISNSSWIVPEARSSRPGQAVYFVREGGIDCPSQEKYHPA
jgi:hypothetical protein